MGAEANKRGKKLSSKKKYPNSKFVKIIFFFFFDQNYYSDRHNRHNFFLLYPHLKQEGFSSNHITDHFIVECKLYVYVECIINSSMIGFKHKRPKVTFFYQTTKESTTEWIYGYNVSLYDLFFLSFSQSLNL